MMVNADMDLVRNHSGSRGVPVDSLVATIAADPLGVLVAFGAGS